MMKSTLASVVLLGSLAGFSIAAPASAAPAQVRLAQNTVDDALDRGFDKMDQGDTQGAIAEFSTAIRIDPKHSLAYYSRGRAYDALGNQKAAIADYTKAIQINQKWSEDGLVAAYVSRGNSRDDAGDPQGALSDYAEALRINPNYGLAYENRGITYIRLNNSQLALQNLQKAAQLYKQQGKTRDLRRVMKSLEKLQQRGT